MTRNIGYEEWIGGTDELGDCYPDGQFGGWEDIGRPIDWKPII